MRKKKKKNNKYKKKHNIDVVCLVDNNSCNDSSMINYIIRQLAKKVPINEIATRLFLSAETIYKIIKPCHYDNSMFNNVTTANNYASNSVMDYLHKHIDEIKNDYLVNKLTRIDLCVKYNVSEYYMSKFISENNIYKNTKHART